MKDNYIATPEENNDDLNILTGSFLRNKFFISGSTFIVFLLSFFYGLSKKNVWEGEFEIVLNQKKQPSLSSQLLREYAGGQGGFDLNTEIGILKSQSVLMPIFKDLQKAQPTKFQNISFASFTSNLEVQKKYKTSILRVRYRNTDKSIILPVLENISDTYKNYTNKNKTTQNLLAKDFLLKQIDIYKLKSKNSIRNVQEFAIDQDLILLDLNVSNRYSLNADPNNLGGSLPGRNYSISNIDIERSRVRAANKVRKIDEQLKNIIEMGDDFNKLQYTGSTIPALVEEGLPQKLAKIEEELVELRSKYTDKDPSIIRTVEKRNLLINLLKKRAIGALEAEKLDLEATINSAIRPKEILLKYKELIREAARDEVSLISLENSLRKLELSEEKSEAPWKLITNPTMNGTPVGPQRSRIWIIITILGLIGSFSFSYIKEIRTGKIFEESNLKKLLPLPILKRLKIIGNEIQEAENDLFIDLDSLSNNKIYVIVSNQINLEFNNEVSRFFSKSPNKYQIITINENFPTEPDKKEYLFLTSLGKIDNKEIENLKIKLSISKINLKGLLLIQEEI